MLHHLPEEAVRPLLETLAGILGPGGRLLVKDVDTRPVWMRWFTHALDLAMDPRHPPRYWSTEELSALLASSGFET